MTVLGELVEKTVKDKVKEAGKANAKRQAKETVDKTNKDLKGSKRTTFVSEEEAAKRGATKLDILPAENTPSEAENKQIENFFKARKNRGKGTKSEPIYLEVGGKEYDVNNKYGADYYARAMRKAGASEKEILDNIREAKGLKTISDSDRVAMDRVAEVRSKSSERKVAYDQQKMIDEIEAYDEINGPGSFAALSDEEKKDVISKILNDRDEYINNMKIYLTDLNGKENRYAKFNTSKYNKALSSSGVDTFLASPEKYLKGMTVGELNTLSADLKKGVQTLNKYLKGEVGIDAVETLDNTRVGKILKAGMPDLYEQVNAKAGRPSTAAGGNGGGNGAKRTRTASADDDLPRRGQSSVPESKDAEVKEKKKRFISPMEAALGGAAIGGAGLGIGALASKDDDDDKDFRRMMMLRMMNGN